jgi:hypothetical protein
MRSATPKIALRSAPQKAAGAFPMERVTGIGAIYDAVKAE